MDQKPHYNTGSRNDIACIFSCPGRYEKEKPVSGATGNNLDDFLRCLERKKSNFFNNKSFKDRYDFRITNASANVYFRAKGVSKRSEEKDKLLFTDDNLERLYEEIKDVEKYVICFGKKAELTFQKMQEKYADVKFVFTVLYTRHLSPVSMRFFEDLKTDISIKISHLVDHLVKDLENSSKS